MGLPFLREYTPDSCAQMNKMVGKKEGNPLVYISALHPLDRKWHCCCKKVVGQNFLIGYANIIN